MRHRQPDADLRDRPRLPAARLREIAEEAAIHAEVGLAMAGLDEGYEATVEPPCASLKARTVRVRLLDEIGDALGVVLLVCGSGRIRACEEDGEDWGSEPGPWRNPSEMPLLAADTARLLRESVTDRRIS